MKLGSDIKQAIESLALEKGVTVESMYEALVSAFRSAYMRIPGAAEEARVTLDPDSGEITVYAQELDNDGNVIKEWEPQISDTDFGRIAAQSFKQMMTTKVRDAKRATVLDAYIGREGELVTGIVTQFDSRFNQTIIDLQDAEAVIPSTERIPFERLERGNRIKALITEIRTEAKGIPIIVSRNRAEFVQRMLELEVPELTDGTVELRAIAREAGSRTKIAVFSNDPNVDPKGACVGSRGSRVRQIVNELKGEKLDVVEWREDKIRFIIEALGPADIELVEIDEDTKSAKVIVKDNQLSLAIGKEGQNARLAAKLTGYKIDIEGLGDSPDVEEEAEKKQDDEYNMAKKRIHQIAKELDVASADILFKAKELGIQVKTASSGLTEDEEELVKLSYKEDSILEETETEVEEVKEIEAVSYTHLTLPTIYSV